MTGMESFIEPIKPWAFGKTSSSKIENTDNKNLFSENIKNIVEGVKTSQMEVEQKQYQLATGEIDNMHELPIAEAKAALSVDMMVTLRNKALDSYNEIMRINI